MSKIGVSVQWRLNGIKQDRIKLEIVSRAGIYSIVNIKNGNKYIGQTVCIKDRWKQHLQKLRNGSHFNSHLQNSFDMYGEDSFRFVVLEIVSDFTKLTEKEQEWIDKLKPEYNVILDVITGFNPQSLRNDLPSDFDTYRIPGENFERPSWHKWVYGSDKNPLFTRSRGRRNSLPEAL